MENLNFIKNTLANAGFEEDDDRMYIETDSYKVRDKIMEGLFKECLVIKFKDTFIIGVNDSIIRIIISERRYSGKYHIFFPIERSMAINDGDLDYAYGEEKINLNGWYFFKACPSGAFYACFFNGTFRGICTGKAERQQGCYEHPIRKIENKTLYRVRNFSVDGEERREMDMVFDLNGNVVFKSKYEILAKEGNFWKVQTYRDDCRTYYAIVNDKDEVLQKWTGEA